MVREPLRRALLRESPGAAGFSLLEMMVSISILGVLMLATTASLIHAHRLSDESDERRIAREAIQNQVETFRGMTIQEAAVLANNSTFDVAGLPPIQSGQHGSVQIFLNEADPESPALDLDGAGVDLNGNGTRTDVLTPTDDYRLLPIRISVRWPTTDGTFLNVTLDAVLADDTDFQQLGG